MPTLLDQILTLSNGARFYRADLHNHTPADPGFHCLDHNLSTEEEKKAFAREYVRFAHETQGLDIIGITDHNETGWIRYVQEAAAAEGNKLIVLPGVELGANEGKRQVHFLALFDPGTDSTTIDHFVSSLGLLPDERFDPYSLTPRLTDMNCRDLTARIMKRSGLPIAAHAVRKNGLLHELEGEGRVIAYEDKNLLAIEIPETRNRLSKFAKRLVLGEADYYGNKAVACLNSSDGRGLGKVNGKDRLSIGDRATRIKLSQVSIDALKHALIDFDSRIRLDGEHTEAAYPRLIGLAIDHGFLNPTDTLHSDPFLIHFNQNLNAIIGGRGAGKSTLLEAIRFVFDVTPRTAATAKQSESALSFTLPVGAQVTAYYEMADGTCYEISRVQGEEPQVKAVATGEITGVHPADLLPNGVPLEVYGQKEVYEIANDVTFQLNLIDTYITEALRDLRREETDLLHWLKENGQAILRLDEEISANEQQVQILKSIQLELDRLEKDTTLAQLEQKKELEAEKIILGQLEKLVEKRLALKLPPQSDVSGLADDRFPELTAVVRQIDTHLEQAIAQLKIELTEIWDRTAAVRQAWRDKYSQNEDAYQALRRSYGETATIDRYFELKDKHTELSAVARAQTTRQTELIDLRAQRQATLIELHALRREREYGLRLAKVKELNRALAGAVQVEITPFGNREAYHRFVSELLKKQVSRLSKKVLDDLVAAGEDPLHLAHAIRAEQESPHGRDLPLEQLYNISATNRKKLATVDEETLFALETYRIPDLPRISLRVGEDYRPLNPPLGQAGLSTGQKCTAILSIILVERDTPLVIDQPEDDLDNAFIFREIVQTLRREKERRQFIIATHNANIPVSGDAELILLMEANEQHGWVAHRGSIDDPQIREPVENILEGGREAFRLRQAKYDNY